MPANKYEIEDEKKRESQWEYLQNREISFEDKVEKAISILSELDLTQTLNSLEKKIKAALEADDSPQLLHILAICQAHIEKVKVIYEARLAKVAETIEQATSIMPNNVYNIRDALETYSRHLTNPASADLSASILLMELNPAHSRGTPMFTPEDLDMARERGYEEGFQRRAELDNSRDMGRLDHIDLD